MVFVLASMSLQHSMTRTCAYIYPVSLVPRPCSDKNVCIYIPIASYPGLVPPEKGSAWYPLLVHAHNNYVICPASFAPPLFVGLDNFI